ncbi:MAG: hypothetical protein ACRELS_13600 [Candidatus Rokuibacteriota bacterium]
MLGNGFILTAVLWGSALVFIIERRLAPAAAIWATASAATLFGMIHSPHPSGAFVLAVVAGRGWHLRAPGGRLRRARRALPRRARPGR